MTTEAAEWLRIGVGGIVPVHWNLEKADAGPGTLTGWASVYNVTDLQDDIVVPGAFRKAITDWRTSKRVIPLTLDHQNTAEGVIGSLAKADDSAYGLKTVFRFASTADAQNARTKAREGHLNGLSIFGPIFNKAFDTVAGKAVRVLKEVGLAAVGLTPMPANMDSLVLATKASDTPWSQFSEADYTPEQWRRACLIDTGEGQVTAKSRYKLPVREPGGALNRNGVHAAAARLNQVQVPTEKRAAAARALVRLYGQLGEDPPESLRRMAGTASSSLTLPDGWVDDMRQALSISVPMARKAAVDVLVAAQYGLDDDTGEDDGEDAPDEEIIEDDAAKYALSVVDGLPDAPADPIDAILAEAGQDQVSADLAALETELKGG